MESSKVPCVSSGKQTERVGVHDTAREIITDRWMLPIVSSLLYSSFSPVNGNLETQKSNECRTMDIAPLPALIIPNTSVHQQDDTLLGCLSRRGLLV